MNVQHRQRKILVRLITFIVITAFLCQNIAWAKGGGLHRNIAPESIFKNFDGYFKREQKRGILKRITDAYLKLTDPNAGVLSDTAPKQKGLSLLRQVCLLLRRSLQTFYRLLYSLLGLGGEAIIPMRIKKISTNQKIILKGIINFIKNSDASIAAKRILEKLRHSLNTASRLPVVKILASPFILSSNILIQFDKEVNRNFHGGRVW